MRTVLGDVAVGHIRLTAMHEHLFIDFRVRHDPTGAVLADDESVFAPKHRDHLEANPAAYVANLVRTSVGEATAELAAFAAAGGTTVVDLTTQGLGHDRERLVEASRASGVHIVAGTGHYVHSVHDDYVHDAQVDTLVDGMVQDLTVGDEDGVRCGIIGEIGIDTFEACELKVFDAATVAHTATGASVAVHVRSGVDPSCRPQTVALVERFIDAGGDPARLILCHQDGSGDDRSYQQRVLELGVVMAFDTFGFQVPFWRQGQHIELPTDAQRIQEVATLVADGWERQLVLSHDLCYRMMTVSCGGWGLQHLPTVILPELHRVGVELSATRQMVEETPRRLLTSLAD